MSSTKCYTVRLNRRYDLDLIALDKHPDFSFSKFFKMAMIAWARGDNNFFISPPERKVNITGEIDNVLKHFTLSKEDEADVIEVLDKIKKGYGNSAMKIIFRSYLRYQYISPFLYYDNLNIKAYSQPLKQPSIQSETVTDKSSYPTIPNNNNILTSVTSSPDIPIGLSNNNNDLPVNNEDASLGIKINKSDYIPVPDNSKTLQPINTEENPYTSSSTSDIKDSTIVTQIESFSHNEDIVDMYSSIVTEQYIQDDDDDEVLGLFVGLTNS